jgi:transketolase
VVAIEAGATTGWYEFADAVVGIDRFGASGDGAQVYKRFGFDADAIAEEIRKSFS